jgi:H+/Cl- antiporter ClcA
MAPLILFGTVVTHLFGGSAGREGTAVQLGGSLSSGFGRALKLDAEATRTLLMTGSRRASARSSTPIAGAVFALEVLAIGRVEYRALVPCLVALVGDWTCLAWGIHHGAYHVDAMVPVDALLVAKAGVAGVVFGLVGLAFAEANHALGGWLKRVIPYGPLRPAIGGSP